METITSELLTDSDNHTTCECGNHTISEYVWSDDDGHQSCPLCMVGWQSEQINALKKLLYEMSGTSKEETAEAINSAYAKMMVVDLEYLKDKELDFSKIT